MSLIISLGSNRPEHVPLLLSVNFMGKQELIPHDMLFKVSGTCRNLLIGDALFHFVILVLQTQKRKLEWDSLVIFNAHYWWLFELLRQS